MASTEGGTMIPGRPSFVRLFLSSLKIGSLTLGGGWAMVPLMAREFSSRGWIPEGEVWKVVSLVQGLPGPIAFNTSFVCGMRVLGWRGALAASLGFIAPSFVAIVLVAWLLDLPRGGGGLWPAARFFLDGMRPSLLGLLAASVVRMGFRTLRGIWDPLLLAVSLLGLVRLGLSPTLIVALGAAVGVLKGLIRR